MKKMLTSLVGILALVAALTAPMAALADSSGTTTLTGTVQGNITITPPEPLNFGVFAKGDNVVTGTCLVSADGNWQLTARDQNQGTHSGYMLNGTTPLSQQLQIALGGGSLFNASTGALYTGASGTFNISFDADQNIVGGEAHGTYTVTIVFSGTIVE